MCWGGRNGTKLYLKERTMKIELKNVKHSAFASQETQCFECTIYIDGKKAGTARNSGHGGETVVAPWDMRNKIEAHASTLPPIDLASVCADLEGKPGQFIPTTAESLIDSMLEDYLQGKYLAKHCKTKTLFRRPGVEYKRGVYDAISSKFGPAMQEYLVKQYGESVVILNVLSAK